MGGDYPVSEVRGGKRSTFNVQRSTFKGLVAARTAYHWCSIPQSLKVERRKLNVERFQNPAEGAFLRAFCTFLRLHPNR